MLKEGMMNENYTVEDFAQGRLATMSGWDERAEESTAGLGYGSAAEAWAHVAGARWQREALLSDDVIERAARALLSYEESESDGITWGGLGEYERDVHLNAARVVLVAALGEDESDD